MKLNIIALQSTGEEILHSHRQQILIKSVFPLQAEKFTFLRLLPSAQPNALLVHQHSAQIHRLKLDGCLNPFH